MLKAILSVDPAYVTSKGVTPTTFAWKLPFDWHGLPPELNKKSLDCWTMPQVRAGLYLLHAAKIQCSRRKGGK